MLSSSTVAIQNVTNSRWVSAAGTSANCIVGAGSLLALQHLSRFTAWACFLWLFGAYNLLNSGYLAASAALDSGDWANVIAGLVPPWLWRCVLGLAGAALYYLAIALDGKLHARGAGPRRSRPGRYGAADLAGVSCRWHSDDHRVRIQSDWTESHAGFGGGRFFRLECRSFIYPRHRRRPGSRSGAGGAPVTGQFFLACAGDCNLDCSSLCSAPAYIFPSEN